MQEGEAMHTGPLVKIISTFAVRNLLRSWPLMSIANTILNMVSNFGARASEYMITQARLRRRCVVIDHDGLIITAHLDSLMWLRFHIIYLWFSTRTIIIVLTPIMFVPWVMFALYCSENILPWELLSKSARMSLLILYTLIFILMHIDADATCK